MTDKIINFYTLLDNKHKQKLPSNYKNHFIKPCSRIGLIGASGTGKTNSLLNFIIIIFNFSYFRVYLKIINNSINIHFTNTI